MALADFNAAINYWWNDKQCRPNQRSKRIYSICISYNIDISKSGDLASLCYVDQFYSKISGHFFLKMSESEIASTLNPFVTVNTKKNTCTILREWRRCLVDTDSMEGINDHLQDVFVMLVIASQIILPPGSGSACAVMSAVGCTVGTDSLLRRQEKRSQDPSLAPWLASLRSRLSCAYG